MFIVLVRNLLELGHPPDGILTRAEAKERGFTNRMLRIRIARGELEEVLPGVLWVCASPYTWRSGLRAATTWAAPAAGSHRAAAAQWGLDGFPRNILEISTSRRLQAPRSEITVHQIGDLPQDQVRFRDGLPFTSIERTLLDLGAVCPPGKVENAVDDALRQRLTTLERLNSELDRFAAKGRNGCGVLRALVDERRSEGVSESRFERALFRFLKESDLPRPVKQFAVVLDGRTCRFDFAYPHARFAIEALSYLHHSAPSDWENDQDRHNVIMVAGWRVMYTTYRALCTRRAKIVETIRRALEYTQPTLDFTDCTS